jgi:isopentenyl-diphosphate Delta-isomerase
MLAIFSLRGLKMEEYLDIVDENDTVIGRDTRKNVHDNYAIHRGVHVFVVTPSRHIVVQKRSMLKDYYPGFYDISVGAQVASGESYLEAGRRELAEELGCGHLDLVYVGKYDAFSSRQREKRHVFRHVCGGPFQLQPTEVDEIQYLSMTALEELLSGDRVTEGFRRSFALFREALSDSSDPLASLPSEGTSAAGGADSP